MTAIDILEQPYARMVLPDGDGGYFAEIVEFPGCFATGLTPSEALEELDSVARDWIDAALEQGQNIPEPFDAAGYSGKFVLRLPKSLHKRAALFAERDGTSLNQFVTMCLSECLGTKSALRLFFQMPALSISQTNVNFIAELGPPQKLTTNSLFTKVSDHMVRI